jgi:hypothetical protein
LPEQYINFLRTVNGLDFNGLVIYRADSPSRDSGAADAVYGFVETNEIWHENELGNLGDAPQICSFSSKCGFMVGLELQIIIDPHAGMGTNTASQHISTLLPADQIGLAISTLCIYLNQRLQFEMAVG